MNQKQIKHIYKDEILSQEDIRLAIEKGEDLAVLYACQKLNDNNQKLAIEKGGEDLWALYHYQKLSQDNIKLGIQKGGEYLYYLFKYQKNIELTAE